MARLFPFLRLKARVLTAFALIAALAPAVVATIPPAQAAPFSVLVCTSEGLVNVVLGDASPAVPDSHTDREHCPACLRADPVLAMPPQAAPAEERAAAAIVRADHATAGAPRRVTAHARPDPTGPPTSV